MWNFDTAIEKTKLAEYFKNEGAKLSDLGTKVNQTFEAFVFASTIKWYQNTGWSVTLHHPTKDGKPFFRLKFNTRGYPQGYTYARCQKDRDSIQIRHSLRVKTKTQLASLDVRSNIVLDVAVIEDIDLSGFASDDAIQNSHLIAFGEAKHLNAYAELMANFIGLVHEIQPKRLKRIRTKAHAKGNHVAPFIYVSGDLYFTAQGIIQTIKKRCFDIDIYDLRSNRLVK